MFDKSACESCLTIKELSTIHDIAMIISNQFDLETSLEKSMKILKNTLNLSNCIVHILEEEELRVFSSIELSNFQKKLSTYKIGEGATGLAAESKEPVVIENVHNDTQFLNKSGKRDSTNQSYVAVPMMVDNQVVGVLGATITKSTAIGFEDTVRILTIIASLFGQSIYSFQLNTQEKERLKELRAPLKIVPNPPKTII